MKKYLVDTTVFIDHLRNKKEATEFLKKKELVVSAVTIAELIQGARDKKEQQLLEKLVNQFEVSWGSAQICRLAISLLSQYFLKYNLRFLDALIAATAISNNLILVTGNTKHFQYISDLKVTTLKEAEKL